MFVTVFNPTDTPVVVDGTTGASCLGLSWAPADENDPVVEAAVKAGRLHVYPQPLEAGPGQSEEAVAAVAATAAKNAEAAAKAADAKAAKADDKPAGLPAASDTTDTAAAEAPATTSGGKN